MKTRILLSVLMIGMVVSITAQPTMTLTFTAENNGQHLPLDSILIENLTQGGDTTLFAPDTVLVIDFATGIDEFNNFNNNGFSLSQNYPNPMNGKTTINLYFPFRENILITVSDVIGRELVNQEFQFDAGHHSFNFYPGKESLYFLTARSDQESQTIKMINSPSNAQVSGQSSLEYKGKLKGSKDNNSEGKANNFVFSMDDELQYTASTTLGNMAIIDTPSEDQTYIFDYASAGIPCPGTPTLTDIEGNVYNTVLIGSQCWMKENLKTTTYNNEVLIPNVTDQETWGNLSTSAYAWFDNDIVWKDIYGALYNGYTIVDEDNELCPSGWHVPSEAEWAALFDHIGGFDDPFGNELKSCRQVDSPLGGMCNTIDHPRWNLDAIDYGTDTYGFAGLPGSFRSFAGPFDGLGSAGYWWTSTESGNQLECHFLNSGFGFVGGTFFSKNYGLSVRCVKD